MNRLLDAALARAREGASLIPLYATEPDGTCTCHKRSACESPGKHPRTQRGLLDASTDVAVIRRWWQMWPDANAGERTDELVRVDIDLVDVADALADDVPLRVETRLVRTARRGGLHIGVATNGGVRGRDLFLADGRKLGELKAAGGYVVIPPSRIGTREYTYLSDPDVATVPRDDPVAWLASILPAFGYELTTSSPKREYARLGGTIYENQGRHNALVSYAGRVWLEGMSADTLLDLLRVVNDAQCRPPLPDPEVQDIARFFAEQRQPGEMGVPITTAKPMIMGSGRHLHEMSGDGWRSLPQTLFQHGPNVSEIRRDAQGRARIALVGQARMRGKLDRSAAWMRKTKQGVQKGAPPKEVVEDMLANPVELPTVKGVIGTPMFATDGTLDTTPGYQERTQLYYDPVGEPIPPVPLTPDASDLRRARAVIGELLQDFEFADDASRANAIAVPITAIAREMILGSTPLFAFGAPTPGTGKTLLAQCLGVVLSGYPPAATAAPRQEEEMRKRITSVLLDGVPMVLLDNVKRMLSSDSLGGVLTTAYWGDRLLAKNQSLELPVRCIWAVTGNNLQFDIDLTRRTVSIALDARVDRPWERQGFRNALPEWAVRHRHELVWSFLVLIQHWIVRGRPAWSGAALGSYEAWSILVGGVLETAGIDGFLTNRADLYRRMDTETEEWRAFVDGWWELFGDRPVRCSELLDVARETVSSVFLAVKEKSEGGQMSAALGRAMRTHRDRRYENIFIRAATGDGHAKVNTWRLEFAWVDDRERRSPAGSPHENSRISHSIAGDAGLAGVLTGVGVQEERNKVNSPDEPIAFQPPQPPQPPHSDSEAGQYPAGNLRGSAGDRCRKCGTPLEPAATSNLCDACRREWLRDVMKGQR